MQSAQATDYYSWLQHLVGYGLPALVVLADCKLGQRGGHGN